MALGLRLEVTEIPRSRRVRPADCATACRPQDKSPIIGQSAAGEIGNAVKV